jgi:acetolactate synthase-1/2/3 large subunit
LGAEAIAAARAAPGRIATLVVPSDAAWSEGGSLAPTPAPLAPAMPDAGTIEEAARLLRNGLPSALLLGSHTTQGPALAAASQISAATGARLLAPFAFARMERGAGRPAAERIAYVTDQAFAQLADLRQLLLVGAPEPVAFFGHPTRPGRLSPEGCAIFSLAQPHEDCAGALHALANALDATNTKPVLQSREEQAVPPDGPITHEGIARTVSALLPEAAIVVDESITSGRGLMAATKGAPPHDWLVNTGGSIGIAVPLAVGAAIASPDRPVLCLEGDGSLMYTLQGLWTAARENLPITTVVFANRSYAILKGELAALGTNPGPRALQALDIAPPVIAFADLARALGVPARRATTLGQFADALRRALASKEPNLIEVAM